MTVTRPGPDTAASPPEPVAHPAGRTLRLGPTSWLLRPRAAIVIAAIVVVALLLFLTGLGLGYTSPVDVARILLGGGNRFERIVIFDEALPRGVAALLVGFGLGLSGCLTQVIARNPLATPDILGITAGASVTAVAAIAFGGSWGAWLAQIGVPAAALLGGLVTAMVMYGLSWTRHGELGMNTLRLVLIGVGVSWMLQAVTGYLLTRANIYDVGRAQTWLVGSLGGMTWPRIWPALIAVIVGIVLVSLISRDLTVMGLGADVARGLGIRVATVTTTALLTAVVVAALCVSTAGPIAFVALLAPQIARRLAGTAMPTPMMSGLTGALLVVASDVVGRGLLPDGLPVGIVTAALGGPFLIYLMLRLSRKEAV